MYEQLNIKPLCMTVDGETIAGRQVASTEATAPTTLFLHGGGKSSGERVMYLMTPLAERGMSSVAIDFSGHGRSTGRLEESSLRKRTLEAASALNWLDKSQPATLCGSSMGAHNAIRLLQYVPARALILFCPAVYSRTAFDVPFNKGFSKIIREPDSWRNSETFDILSNFTGRLLVLIGSRDGVIPQELPETLLQSASHASCKELFTVSDADHFLHAWIKQHPAVLSDVLSKLSDYLS